MSTYFPKYTTKWTWYIIQEMKREERLISIKFLTWKATILFPYLSLHRMEMTTRSQKARNF